MNMSTKELRQKAYKAIETIPVDKLPRFLAIMEIKA